MPKYTTICCDRSHRFGDTLHVSAVEAENQTQAATLARAECARDWDQKESSIAVIGVLEGDTNVLEWDDNGIDLPKPQVLLGIKVDFDAWPGAPFRGGHIIEIDRETFDDELKFREAFLPEITTLLEDLADDDAEGPNVDQIKDAVYATLTAWLEEGEFRRAHLVLASGRYKLDEHGDPELYSGTSSPVFDEQFDITVSIIPVMGDEPDEDD